MFQNTLLSHHHPRLAGGGNDRKNVALYIKNGRRALTLQSAATAWACGVPWAEALDISQRAIEKADPFAKAKAKAKARGRR